MFGAGVTAAVLLLAPFGAVGASDRFIGAPAAFASFIVLAGALVGGPRVGLGLALVSGALFDALVITDRWLVAGSTSILVLVVWGLMGTAAGMLGDRYRIQIARSLEEATEARAAMQRIVEATPAFHIGGSPTAVADAVCRAAIETFECDVAALFEVQDDHLRLLARAPEAAVTAPVEAQLGRFPELSEQVIDGLQPSFVEDLTRHEGPSIIRDLAGARDQIAALRVPVVLDGRPTAVLALSWGRPQPRASAEQFALVQRFVEHAAVALAQARRAEAQREVEALQRRFQTSLMPVLDIDDPHMVLASHYQPGEQRLLLGGDFIDVVHHGDGKLSAVLGDVTGHGPDAAAFGSTLRVAWRVQALGRAPLADNLSSLNALAIDESERAEVQSPGMSMLATLCAVEVDLPEGVLRVADAGHPPPLWLTGGQVQPLEGSTNIMLGVDPHGTWPSRSIEIGSDPWALLLYSDGLIEARRAPGVPERLGVDGLMRQVLSQWRRGPLDETALENIAAEPQEAQGRPFDDDATLLLIRSRPNTSG